MKTYTYANKIVFIKLLLILLINVNGFSQQVTINAEPDTSFPVTNRYNEIRYPDLVDHEAPGVFNIAKANGNYYLFGNFTNLALNHGSALVLDSLTGNINTSMKWKINGMVFTSIPDGAGGFYIGGSFTRIGDSTRNYIAQIDRFGRPTTWKPVADSAVNQISQRNDTLFIGGAFHHFAGQPRPYFAMYNISSNTLLSSATTGALTVIQGAMASFLIDHDTIIYAARETIVGQGGKAMVKYCFKTNAYLPWQLVLVAGIPPGEILGTSFNYDSSLIIYHGYDYDAGLYYIRAVNKKTGVQLYRLLTYYDFTNTGRIRSVKVVGNKVYVAGEFETIYPPPGMGSGVSRHGFAVFNAGTGAVLNDQVPVTGYPSFIDSRADKLFISGKFTAINGAARENFAVLDTGTYTVGSWQLSPTDPLYNIAFSDGSIFIGGLFNGIHSVHRNGFAAIDAATNTILPWSPQDINAPGGKRMLITGDTLFVLTGNENQHTGITCNNSLVSGFHMISVSTGAEIMNHGELTGRMNDFVIAGNFIYVSFDHQLRRYTLPGLHEQPGLNLYFSPTNPNIKQVVWELFVKNDTLFTIGDTREEDQCDDQPLLARRGWVGKTHVNGGAYTSYYYEEQHYGNQNAQPFFDHGILLGNKLFISGAFDTLNGNGRNSWVCINTDDGIITNWSPGLDTSYWHVNWNSFRDRPALKLVNNKIWVGGLTDFVIRGGGMFPGFAAIDTATAQVETPPMLSILQSQFYNIPYNDFLYYIYKPTIKDFLLDNDQLLVTGSFDTINNVARASLARYKLNNSPGHYTYVFNGDGNWIIASNWLDNNIPPSVLPGGDTIIIDPVLNGKCFLNISQVIDPGGTIVIKSNKKFEINGNLTVIE